MRALTGLAIASIFFTQIAFAGETCESKLLAKLASRLQVRPKQHS